MGEEARGREESLPLIRRLRRILRFAAGLLPVRPPRHVLRHFEIVQAGPEGSGEEWREVEVGVEFDADSRVRGESSAVYEGGLG